MKSDFFFARNFLSPVAGATVMLPQGVPFESLNIYIFLYKYFFNLKISYEIGLFLQQFLFSLVAGATVMLPYGVPFESLNIYILPYKNTFLIWNSQIKSAFFFARNFLSPVAGATVMLPYGVIHHTLSFYQLHTLYLQTTHYIFHTVH